MPMPMSMPMPIPIPMPISNPSEQVSERIGASARFQCQCELPNKQTFQFPSTQHHSSGHQSKHSSDRCDKLQQAPTTGYFHVNRVGLKKAKHEKQAADCLLAFMGLKSAAATHPVWVFLNKQQIFFFLSFSFVFFYLFFFFFLFFLSYFSNISWFFLPEREFWSVDRLVGQAAAMKFRSG